MTEPGLSTRSVAFYLPQYHPVAENDLWWGSGFTDWVNVEKAGPLFDGHPQPDLPGELGAYSLLDPGVRSDQASLAAQHRIDAFCWYHYWFEGRRLLERPFDEVLTLGEPDHPFCLCWANEDWTRQWSGSGEVLVRQTYSPSDDVIHGQWLARAIRDARYLRVENRAVLLVYRAWALPDPIRTARTWRQIARSEGAGELLLCAVRSDRFQRADPRQIGFDAAVEFQPDWTRVRPPLWRSAPAKIASHIGLCRDLRPRYSAFDYDEIVRQDLDRPDLPFTTFPCVMPGWDNTPRRSRDAIVVAGSSPSSYGRWVSERLKSSPELLFVNAWNEWAEGCHLEPGLRWGRAYLEAHASAMTQAGP